MAPIIGAPTKLDSIDDLPEDELRHILRHFSAPPPPSVIHQQELCLANVPPMKLIPHNLIPHFYDKFVIPPRLYLGFRFDEDHAAKTAIAHGCDPSSISTNRTICGRTCIDPFVYTNFLSKLIRRATGYVLRFKVALTGKSERYLTSIYVLGSNYEVREMDAKQVLKVAEILGFSWEDVRWWIDSERWYWDDGRNRFDLKQCQQYRDAKSKETTQEAV